MSPKTSKNDALCMASLRSPTPVLVVHSAGFGSTLPTGKDCGTVEARVGLRVGGQILQKKRERFKEKESMPVAVEVLPT